MNASSLGRTDRPTPGSGLGRRVALALHTPSGAVYPILLALLVVLLALNPSFAEPGQFTRLIARMAPVVVVTLGAFFVLVCGEFDLSIGAVIAAQVVIAGNFIGQNDGRILPALLLMLVLAVAVGLVNGLVTAWLKVPGFVTTLGMMLALNGITFWSTGGAASGNPSDRFRDIGRGGIDVPVISFLPWSLFVLAASLGVGVWLMHRPFGRLLLAVGDNEEAVELAGASVWWLRTRAYILSAVFATVAAVLLVGFAGTYPTVGQGYQYTAIAAAVIGGVVLGGGRGWIVSAAAGALVLETLMSVLTALGISSTWQNSVQGVVILAAVAVTAVHLPRPAALRRRRRRSSNTSHSTSIPAEDDHVSSGTTSGN